MQVKFKDLRYVVELIRKQSLDNNAYCDFISIERDPATDCFVFRFDNNFGVSKEIKVYDKDKKKNPMVHHMEDVTKLVTLD